MGRSVRGPAGHPARTKECRIERLVGRHSAARGKSQTKARRVRSAGLKSASADARSRSRVTALDYRFGSNSGVHPKILALESLSTPAFICRPAMNSTRKIRDPTKTRKAQVIDFVARHSLIHESGQRSAWSAQVPLVHHKPESCDGRLY